MRLKLNVLNELKNWSNTYQRKLDTETLLRNTVKECTKIRKRTVKAFEGWMNGTIPVPPSQEREEEMSKINDLAQCVTELRDSLMGIYDYLDEWETKMSNLPNKHRRLLELMYKERKSLEQICEEMNISEVQALKLHQQCINLLRAIG